MSCCSNVITNLGCFNACDTIDIGFNAVQAGTHIFEVSILSGVIQSTSVSILLGGDLIIPASTLNESSDLFLRVKQPDGTYYAFAADSNCATIRTRVHVA